MRKLLYILISLLTSCDVVDSNQYLKPYDPGAQTNQNVLLEEYTGMKCVNCPAAAVQAQLLKKIYGERLIVVSIHAGAFAEPAGIFTQDLRTEAGDKYFSWFGFAGTPAGAVNRAPYSGSLSVNPSRWASAIKQETNRTSHLELTITTEFDPNTRALTTLSTIMSIDESAELSNLKLTVWMLEDSISTPQIIPSGVDLSYMQRHVLRHTLSETWGDTIYPDPKATRPTATAKHTTSLPMGYNVTQCSIVAFVSDATTARIIQVSQKAVLQRP